MEKVKGELCFAEQNNTEGGAAVDYLGVEGQDGRSTEFSMKGSCCMSRGDRIRGGEWKGELPKLRAPITGLRPKKEIHIIKGAGTVIQKAKI